jgi:hypothetical protein
MSSIMRWRSGEMASALMGTLLSEVDDTSILRRRRKARYHYFFMRLRRVKEFARAAAYREAI